MNPDFDSLYEIKEKQVFDRFYKKLYKGRVCKAEDTGFALEQYIKEFDFHTNFLVGINDYFKEFIDFFEAKRKLGISVSKTIKLVGRIKNRVRPEEASFTFKGEEGEKRDKITEPKEAVNINGEKGKWNRDFSGFDPEILVNEYATWKAKERFLKFLKKELEKVSKNPDKETAPLTDVPEEKPERKEKRSSSLADEEHFTTEQLAEFLHCSRQSIYNYRQQGLPSIGIGRKRLFNKREVLAFLDKATKGKRRTPLNRM